MLRVTGYPARCRQAIAAVHTRPTKFALLCQNSRQILSSPNFKFGNSEHAWKHQMFDKHQVSITLSAKVRIFLAVELTVSPLSSMFTV